MSATANSSTPGLGSTKGASKSAAATSVVKAEKTSMKFDVCIDTLMNGCVNAFVTLFTLSHRPPICVDELAQKMFVIPDEKLPWVQDALINVEMKRRRSDFRGIFAEAMKLAEYFEGSGDKEQAVYFHRVALAHSSESLDRALEGLAHEKFGLLYERLKQTAEACTHHEARLKLAEIVGDQNDKARASENLFRVYMKRGEEELAQGNPRQAKIFFEKGVAIAKASSDTKAEADAYTALGNVTVLLGDLQKALEYQQRFLLVSKSRKNDHGEAVAALEVAKLQETLGQTDEAITSLKTALSLAEQSGDLKSICESCRQLGEVYKKANQNVKAAHYFTQAFKVAQDIGDPKQVEETRTSLGFALGEHYFSADKDRKGFLGVVCNDMHSLLDWMGTGVL